MGFKFVLVYTKNYLKGIPSPNYRHESHNKTNGPPSLGHKTKLLAPEECAGIPHLINSSHSRKDTCRHLDKVSMH